MMRRADEVDDEEGRRYGADRRGGELPGELSFRDGRLRKIREAMAELESEAQVAAEQAEAQGEDHSGVPEDKAQRNFTDAESRIMPAPGGRGLCAGVQLPGCGGQRQPVIVAARATNPTSDKQQAVAMVEEVISNVGMAPREVSADAGYYSAQAVEGLYGLNVDPFVRRSRPVTAGLCHQRPRSDTPTSVCQGSDAPETADQAGPQALRSADADCGAGVRSDQAGPWLPSVPVAGTGEGQRRVVVDLHRPQPAQTVPRWRRSVRQGTAQPICSS